MTTETYQSLEASHKPYLELISSTEDPSLWSHPVLDIFAPPKHEIPQQKAKLYLVPTTFGEDIDFDEMPIPTSASELPELHAWTMKFIVSVLEIWAGRRQPAQLIRSCHRVIYMELLRSTGSQQHGSRQADALGEAGVAEVEVHTVERSAKWAVDSTINDSKMTHSLRFINHNN